MNDLELIYEEVFGIDDFIEESENTDPKKVKSPKAKLLKKIAAGLAIAAIILLVARKVTKNKSNTSTKSSTSTKRNTSSKKSSGATVEIVGSVKYNPKKSSEYYYSEFKKDIEKDIKMLKEARTYLKNVDLEDKDKKSKLEEQNKKVDKALKQIGETWKEFFNKHKTELIDSGYYKEMQQKIARIGFSGISVFDNPYMYDYAEYFK